MLNLIHGDCVEQMKVMSPESIDLVITSPPYDNLRSYNGYSFDFESTAQQLFRVIKKGGVVVWIVGDATIKGSETGTSFKQALFFKEIGFNLHDTMIYSRYAMPNGSLRYNQDFEYMFILSKDKPKTFNPIQEPCKYAGIGTSPTSRNRNGELISNGKRIIKDTKKRSNIWHYTAGVNKSTHDSVAHKHPAIFPESLVHDHIISWSNEGDTILDPMMGSGTTGKMAKLLNRNFIGIEISAEYIQLATQRTGEQHVT